ncbi:protein MALE DISCOVERER 2-like isoform X2 [Vigna unguiculata]|uniref:protein MALE DISCOVERER 2-like isoform X2 n=1 Tax=Vigna unguiculata TaxID=3917 RepID=UPI0010162714|nr:protein MALE DISCOVERER 2-like isoform X2 [Vigna unguiculata]
MELRWNTFGFCLRIYIFLFSLWGIRDCCSVNDEGLALLAFQARITSDPFNALVNWDPNDCNPCEWLGVHCVDGKVQVLDLKGLSLEGTLAPELGKLSHLNSIVLCKNNFSGAIPKELGDLPKLELLDLRENNLSGNIPAEIGNMSLLKHFVWQRSFNQWYKSDSLIILTKAKLKKFANAFAWPLLKLGKTASHSNEADYCDILPSSDVPKIAQNVPEIVSSTRRKLLQSSGNNLAAVPFSDKTPIEFSTAPTTFSSGAIPAVPEAIEKKNRPAPSDPDSNAPDDASDENQSDNVSDENQSQDASDGNQASQQHLNNGASTWKWIIIFLLLLLVIIIIILLYIWRKRAAKVIRPWKTGISGQLRKAFITGVPKLDRGELETACEDFSNIVVDGYAGCTIYKGTLSSGVEIAVVSTLVTSSKNWSKSMELRYRKKIDTLSRINHKNFVNLIGYCEEQEPFTRMLVFEYAPNGNVFEHLHVADLERLDWSARIKIIMGIAYCLQYMHHDLNPPLAQSNLTSNMIFLTDDFSAKVAEVTFRHIVSPENSGDSKKSDDGPSEENIETNIYNFGELLLEIISGKLSYSEEHGNLVDWAATYLNEKTNLKDLVDPTLQCFKENELNCICDVIQDCIQPDEKLRPTMRDVTSKLREVLGLSPEQVVPRLSPLWWAELEILSVDST